MRTLDNYFVFFIPVLGSILMVSGDDYQEFYDELLALHNEYRARHSAPPLSFDENMSNIATQLAWTYINDEPKIPGKGYVFGENYYSCRYYENERDMARESAEHIFLSWYDEGQRYKYTREPSNRSLYYIENFTQIVWKSTTSLGIAKVEQPGKMVVVVTYNPPGNQYSHFRENVNVPRSIN